MSKEKRRVPKLRFPGFTEDWEQRKLESLGEIITGNTPSTLKKEYWSTNSEGVVWITPTDINSVKTDWSERLLTEEGASQARIVPANSILVTCIASIGKNTINTVEAAFNQQINALVPHLSNSYFILTMLNNMESAFKRVAGTSATSIINKKEFGQLSALLPRVEEQNKIGEIFELIDKSITLHQRKLEHLNLKKKALLQKLFPKNGERYPELRFPGFTDAWEQRKLGSIGSTYTGLSGKTKEDFGHGEAKYITYLNVFQNTISNITMTDKVEIDPTQNEVKYGDVLFTTSSETPEEVGMSSVWLGDTPNIYLNSFCFGFRPNQKIDSYFLGFSLRAPYMRDKIKILAQGISRYNISKNKVMELEISLPNNEEQKLLGTFLQRIDLIITLHQRKLEHLQLQKKALLQQMFV